MFITVSNWSNDWRLSAVLRAAEWLCRCRAVGALTGVGRADADQWMPTTNARRGADSTARAGHRSWLPATARHVVATVSGPGHVDDQLNR